MTSSNIIVAAWDERLAEAENVARRLRAHWPSPVLPTFTVACGHSLEPDGADAIDAVILVAGEAGDDATVLALLSMLEEASVPVLALLDAEPAPGNCFEFAGALVQRSDINPTLLAIQLRTLCHRQDEVRRLRQEIALAHRLKGGLHGQMTKIHEELQLAAMVQREFLPKEVPALHGIDVAAMWRPSNYVSGDIYDIIRLDENHVGVFLADAIGHGVPAALMTMVICRSLEVKEVTGSNYRIVPPSEVLARLNDRLVHRQTTNSRFVTAVYATIDCRRRVMTIASAGHPPSMLLRGDGTTEMMETSGGLLGVFEDEQYEQTRRELGPDDRLLMYSDGFELLFPDENVPDDGRRRTASDQYLHEFQSLRTPEDAAGMIRHIARRIDDQQGSLHQRDDVTLLCLHAGEPEPTTAVRTSLAPAALRAS